MSRRIVTGNVEGRSRVISDEEIVFDGFSAQVWTVEPDALPSWISPHDPATALPFEPAAGASRSMIVHLTPENVREQRAMPLPGVREHGFHTTRSIDYVVVLDGWIRLDLDDESVDLAAGDVVIQQATSHAWSTVGEESGTFFVVVTTVDALL
ncbi:hypothetical protein [Microbacterium sp. SORGH_AS_0888]|uniref:hypothetical protein n=1 Tax=Microbacterium sp. SORGH_AS_0888 TaxID=3041791 RepID=UPI002787744B|nr:hypothetical protein [Microbacterium sp. SORGH_AS_0888]MDQ1131012.1 quercetin dioxygenase-like cupin family protein [Microbacterium sp. SORGH_AS_0888]